MKKTKRVKKNVSQRKNWKEKRDKGKKDKKQWREKKKITIKSNKYKR